MMTLLPKVRVRGGKALNPALLISVQSSSQKSYKVLNTIPLLTPPFTFSTPQFPPYPKFAKLGTRSELTTHRGGDSPTCFHPNLPPTQFLHSATARVTGPRPLFPP